LDALFALVFLCAATAFPALPWREESVARLDAFARYTEETWGFATVEKEEEVEEKAVEEGTLLPPDEYTPGLCPCDELGCICCCCGGGGEDRGCC
jgi:hypothetical protein